MAKAVKDDKQPSHTLIYFSGALTNQRPFDDFAFSRLCGTGVLISYFHAKVSSRHKVHECQRLKQIIQFCSLAATGA